MNVIKNLMGAAVLVALGSFAMPAGAAITTYSTQAAFDAAFPAETNINFDSIAPASGNTYLGDPGSTSVGGDTFSTSNLLFVISALPTDGPYGSTFLTAQTSSAIEGDFTIKTHGVTAIGFNYGAYVLGATPLTATLNTGETFNLGDPTGVAQFIGLSSSGAPIQSITLSGIDTDAPGTVIDLINVSQAGGVPEPATWAMMLVGIGGIGGVMRSRRRWAALPA